MIQSLPVDHPLKHDPLCRLLIDNLPYATAILDSNLKYLLACWVNGGVQPEPYLLVARAN